MDRKEDGMWFAPKRYGYGAGLPIAWQGWALLGGYIALMVLAGFMSGSHLGAIRAAAFALFIAATATLLSLTRQRTRGGWKWRWGNDN